MLWLLPFICSAGICWLNRGRIAAVMAPPVAARPAFGAGPFASSPYLLPRAAAGYGSTPYSTGQLLLPQHAGAPAASPFAYANPLAPAMAAPEPVMAPAVSPALSPIAVMRCGADGCMIRPEPRPWDDATLGRMPGAFTAPKDFPVYVLSFGPVGWAHVLVNHPDEGAVEGWVETRLLTDAPASPPATSVPIASPTGTGQVPSPRSVRNARKEAITSWHEEFMRKRGQQGRAALPPPQHRRK